MLLVLVVLILIMACGGSGSDSSSEFVRVSDSEATYSIDDLLAIDYKVSKTYDVAGLTEADAAYYGFWRSSSSSDPFDYEVRVYPSHAVAISAGTSQAEEVTGDDAVLDRSLSSWPEGINDRRKVVGPGASRSSAQPRYADFVIFGNLVMLCEGRNLEHAREQCTGIVDALR